MSSPEQTVFNLPVGWVLTADEIPVEVMGCVKYLDAAARPQYWIFNSQDLTAVEAAGMAEFMRVQAADDLTTHMYLTQTRAHPACLDDEDDTDDDD